jgi:hypothetical protein
MKKSIIIRLILTVGLLFGIYPETGFWSTLSFFSNLYGIRSPSISKQKNNQIMQQAPYGSDDQHIRINHEPRRTRPKLMPVIFNGSGLCG